MSTQGETFRKSCELLHDVGKYMPLANQILAMLKTVIAREGIKVSHGAGRFFGWGR